MTSWTTESENQTGWSASSDEVPLSSSVVFNQSGVLFNQAGVFFNDSLPFEQRDLVWDEPYSQQTGWQEV